MNIKGRRQGGRKPNTPNKFSAARSELAAKDGPLPHENMLRIARNLMALALRYAPKRVAERDGEGNEVISMQFAPGHEDKYVYLLTRALVANAKAAPYFAPRLASMAITHKHIDLSKLTDDELATIESIVQRATEPGSDPDRTGATCH